MITQNDAPAVPATPLLQRIGQFVFRYRDYLAPAGLALILIIAPPQYLFGSERADFWLDLLGVAVCAVGQALRMTVIGYAYIVRGGSKKKLAAPKLVCEGFYAHSRNPMYVGNFLLLLGLALIYNSLWVYLLALPVFYGGLLSIVKAEETFLRGEFGDDYEKYCQTTPRFVPRLRGLRTTLQSMRFNWRRVLRKEYGTTFAWTSVALFLMVWERVRHVGWQATRPHLTGIAVAWAAVFLWWGTIRFLKKTRRLEG